MAKGTKPRTVVPRASVLLLFLVASTVRAQPSSVHGFDEYVSAAVRDWNVPGLAVAVVKDGELVFANGYGVLELGKPEKTDEHTIFAIGSTTKAMTAAAMGILVDEGKVNWDDPVTKHLPDFQLYDPYVTREVTIRDLLTHRAGLGNADFLWYGQDNPRKNILDRLRLLPPQTSMRSHFTYQNIMYAAAGEVVARVSDTTWEAFVRKRILKPLGMSDTVVLLEETRRRPNVASPHHRVEGQITVIENASVDAVAAAGSIWSSVSDMAKWMHYLLEGNLAGKPNAKPLLSEETHNELFKPQFIVDRDEFYPTARLTKPHWTTYALGWFQHDYNGRAVDFHTGSIDGMVAIIGLIRDERLGVYVLGNLDHAEVRHAIMYRVFDHFGEGPKRDWSAELGELYGELRQEAAETAEKAKAERVPNTSPSLPSKDYVGTYSDPLFGTAVVALAEGNLKITYGPGRQGELEHWHFDTFQAQWEAKWRGTTLLSFVLDTKGQPTTLRLGGASFTLDKTEGDTK